MEINNFCLGFLSLVINCYFILFLYNIYKKMGLTGVAMETMRPSGPVKLESIESGLYKEVSTISHKNHVQYKFNSGIESWSIALHNY